MLLLRFGVLFALTLTATAQTCPDGWITVNGACAKPCTNPFHNNLQGLCSGGTDPFAGVYCNSVNGTSSGVLETDRFNVKNSTGGPVSCISDADCDKYGTGYFCDVFTPKGSNVSDHPTPQCVRPAAPACFPLIPVSWNATFACPPYCPP